MRATVQTERVETLAPNGAPRPLRVLTVDDEPLALRRLELMLADIENVDHVGAAQGRANAQLLIAEQRPDVVLLDIRMRDGTGFDVVEGLLDHAAPVIVFVTAFDDFAVRAFEINAADYVLKPVSAERLRQALDRARVVIETTSAADRISELRAIVDNLRDRLRETSAKQGGEFWVRRGATDFVRVGVDTIQWVTAEDDYVRLHTGERSYLVRNTIRGVMATLDEDQFVRIHRSTLVRIGAIAQVRRVGVSSLELEMTGGVRLRAGRVYGKVLRRIVARHGVGVAR